MSRLVLAEPNERREKGVVHRPTRHGVPSSQSLKRKLCGACLRRTTRFYVHPERSSP